GLIGDSGIDRKSSATAMIESFTPIIAKGGEGPYRYDDHYNGYSWTEGRPNKSATNTTTGVYFIGKSSGFRLSVPADTTVRRLKVYVGAFAAKGQFSAALGDNSAPAWSDVSIENTS